MIEKYYNEFRSQTSDINEHLVTLKTLGEECEHITEMGVRSGVSTTALLASLPKRMISYDITDINFTIKDSLIESSIENNIDYTFVLGDSLRVKIEKTDLLFIDTLHTYNQLIKELILHANEVNKYIILHDTTLFGYKDENIYEHASDLIKNESRIKQGLFNAVLDFLEINNDWFIFRRYENNNGLTILKRK